MSDFKFAKRATAAVWFPTAGLAGGSPSGCCVVRFPQLGIGASERGNYGISEGSLTENIRVYIGIPVLGKQCVG